MCPATARTHGLGHRPVAVLGRAGPRVLKLPPHSSCRPATVRPESVPNRGIRSTTDASRSHSGPVSAGRAGQLDGRGQQHRLQRLQACAPGAATRSRTGVSSGAAAVEQVVVHLQDQPAAGPSAHAGAAPRRRCSPPAGAQAASQGAESSAASGSEPSGRGRPVPPKHDQPGGTGSFGRRPWPGRRLRLDAIEDRVVHRPRVAGRERRPRTRYRGRGELRVKQDAAVVVGPPAGGHGGVRPSGQADVHPTTAPPARCPGRLQRPLGRVRHFDAVLVVHHGGRRTAARGRRRRQASGRPAGRSAARGQPHCRQDDDRQATAEERRLGRSTPPS